MRWVIHAQIEFDASHALTSYRGEPETSHEHRWRVAIRVGVEQLNAEGYALDFHAVHSVLERALAPLDGSDLNQHPLIGAPTPSAERLAEVVAGWVGPPIAELTGTLLTVSVWEGPENRVDLNLAPEIGGTRS
jgi:6-pyruvoyl-tetrahydropterin synthase